MPRLQRQFGYRQGKGTKSGATAAKKTQAKASKANKVPQPNVKKFKVK